MCHDFCGEEGVVLREIAIVEDEKELCSAIQGLKAMRDTAKKDISGLPRIAHREIKLTAGKGTQEKNEDGEKRKG